jgi:hypothetical protein
MYKILSAFFLFLSTSVFSQTKNSYWQAFIHRADGVTIPFSFKLEEKNKKTILLMMQKK